MYSNSKKWKAPALVKKEAQQALNKARINFCNNSDIWTYNFDVDKHHEGMKKMWDEYFQRRKTQQSESTSSASHPSAATQAIRQAMSSTIIPEGKFRTNHSAVLSYRTIWTPSFETLDRDLVPWPTKEELEYEGDARAKEEISKRRFLPVPRVPAPEKTTPFNERAFVQTTAFDDVELDHSQAAIFLRTHHIEELEVEDKEGEQLIGKDLIDMLDPVDRF